MWQTFSLPGKGTHRLTTLPSRSTRNLVKFHLMSLINRPPCFAFRKLNSGSSAHHSADRSIKQIKPPRTNYCHLGLTRHLALIVSTQHPGNLGHLHHAATSFTSIDMSSTARLTDDHQAFQKTCMSLCFGDDRIDADNAEMLWDLAIKWRDKPLCLPAQQRCK